MKTDGTRFKKARQAPRNEKPSSKGGENDGPVIIVFILVVLTASVKGEREVGTVRVNRLGDSELHSMTCRADRGPCRA